MEMSTVAIQKLYSLANQGYVLVSVEGELITLSKEQKSVTVDGFGRVNWLEVGRSS
jgi:hypothetical protein